MEGTQLAAPAAFITGCTGNGTPGAAAALARSAGGHTPIKQRASSSTGIGAWRKFASRSAACKRRRRRGVTVQHFIHDLVSQQVRVAVSSAAPKRTLKLPARDLGDMGSLHRRDIYDDARLSRAIVDANKRNFSYTALATINVTTGFKKS